MLKSNTVTLYGAGEGNLSTPHPATEKHAIITRKTYFRIDAGRYRALLRNQLIDRVEVLSKVKQLFLIPGMEMITSKMVADFYEVDAHTLQVCYRRNKEEIDADGVMTLTSKQIREKAQDVTVAKKSNNYTVFAKLENGEEVPIAPKAIYYSPRAVLRIGMLLRDSEVAKEVRTQLI